MLPILHRILIDQTQAIGTRDKDGNIALHEAAYFGNPENVKRLLKADKSLVNKKNYNKETPLFKARFQKANNSSRYVRELYDRVIRELKKYGAY